MSADAALLEAVALLNPRTLDRARRLCEAARLLREGSTPTAVRRIVQVRFRVDRHEAWLVVDMAADMVLEKR